MFDFSYLLTVSKGVEDEVRIPINQQEKQDQPSRTKASVLSKGKAAHLSVEQVCKILQTNLNNGLSSEEAERRLKKYGSNTLPEEKPLSLWKTFLKQFYDFMVLISFLY
jgi:magnesium-transporting ATPase (P-type)